MWPYALTLTRETHTTLSNAATRDLHCLPFNNAGDRGAPFKLHNELGETLMNAIKIALLGTAALAAVSVSARADDLADLKAQIEALNGRISQLEASPSVPAGYQLLSVGYGPAIVIPSLDIDKNDLAMVHTIGIMPTADVPASTVVTWTGGVRVALVYRNTNPSNTFDGLDGPDADLLNDELVIRPTVKTVDLVSRAFLKVVGTTDTAVGEVGARVAMVADSAGRGKLNRGNSSLSTDGYWGWWKITPELTLGGGVDGSLAGNGQGFDGKCSCNYTGDGSGGYGHAGDPTQIRLSYASGPISFAIALEDEQRSDPDQSNKDAFGVAGEFKWAGDSYGFELNAGYWGGSDDDKIVNDTVLPVLVNGLTATEAAWTINAGANVGLGDIANLSVAAGVGEDSHLNGNADRFSKASAFLGFTLSDSVTAELGVSHKWVKGNADTSAAGIGLYYTPVSQLTIGLEGAWKSTKGNVTASGTQVDAALLTIWRF